MTGSCRMADNIDQGVVDIKGEMLNYPGLYITDGSVIPYLTILANSERMTELITKSYCRN